MPDSHTAGVCLKSCPTSMPVRMLMGGSCGHGQSAYAPGMMALRQRFGLSRDEYSAGDAIRRSASFICLSYLRLFSTAPL